MEDTDEDRQTGRAQLDSGTYPIDEIRELFPMLSELRESGYLYLDSAATSLTPSPVIDTIQCYYTTQRVTIHRGGYPQARSVAEAYEAVRSATAAFIGASRAAEIVFTKSATESLNLVCRGYLAPKLQKGDEIMVAETEHHANFVPWQQLARVSGAKLVVIPVEPSTGRLDLEVLRERISTRVRAVAVTAMSNVNGYVPPLRAISQMAHENGAVCVVDGTQLVAHAPVAVQELGCDFFAFSGHKMCGPTGVGALYGRHELLNSMEPLLFGGDMVLRVSEKRSVFQDAPRRFEGGTPNIAGVLGLGAALTFLNGIGMHKIAAHHRALSDVLTEALCSREEVRVLPPHEDGSRNGVLALSLRDADISSLASIMEKRRVMLRFGKLCAHPYLKSLGHDTVLRVSFGPYTSENELRSLVDHLYGAIKLL